MVTYLRLEISPLPASQGGPGVVFSQGGGPKRTVLRTRTKGRHGLCQKPCAAFLGQLLCLNMRQPVTPITMGMRVSMTAQNCPSAWLLGDRELNQFQKNRMNTATAP